MPATKTSRTRRFFGWFARHKIRSVLICFALIIIMIFLYAVVSYKLQEYIEHRQFFKSAEKIDIIKGLLVGLSPTHISSERDCQHSNFGGVFENDTVYCSVTVNSIYVNVDRAQGNQMLAQTKQILQQQGLKLYQDETNQSREAIASYAFGYDHLACYFDAWYYDQSTPSYDRDKTLPPNGTEVETEIYCGGRALKDYFPITSIDLSVRKV